MNQWVSEKNIYDRTRSDWWKTHKYMSWDIGYIYTYIYMNQKSLAEKMTEQ